MGCWVLGALHLTLQSSQDTYVDASILRMQVCGAASQGPSLLTPCCSAHMPGSVDLNSERSWRCVHGQCHCVSMLDWNDTNVSFHVSTPIDGLVLSCWVLPHQQLHIRLPCIACMAQDVQLIIASRLRKPLDCSWPRHLALRKPGGAAER